MKAEIWIADWTFYRKQTTKEKQKGIPVTTYVVQGVVTPLIPVRFIINEMEAYKRAIRGEVMKSQMGDLENDKATGLKKFSITYIKKVQGLQ